MSRPAHHSEDEPQVRLSAELVDELRGLYGGHPAVPATRTQVVLAAARARFAGRRRMKLALRIGGAAAAMAAMVLIAVMVIPDRPGRPLQTPGVARNVSTDRRDLNTDGSVDILDAYLLAKEVERENALDRALDLNLDGKVDRADADSLASAVVALPEGGAVR